MNTQIFVASVIALILGLALGMTLGARKGQSASGIGFAFLGLGFGLTLGLSASPVLGAALTAAFTFAGLVLQAFARQAPPNDEVPPGKIADFARVNAPTFSAAMAPLACMMVAGLLVGIIVRVNNSFQFGETGLRNRYLAEGFDEAQVGQIMAGHARMLAEGRQSLAEASKAPEQPPAVRSVLQASEVTATWQALLQGNIDRDDTPHLSVDRINSASHKDVQNHIERMRKAKMDDGDILKLLKDIKTWNVSE